MLMVVIGWVLFDSESISIAVNYIKVMFGFGNNIIDKFGMYLFSTNIILIIISSMLATKLFNSTFEKIKRFFKMKDITLILFIKIMIFIISISYLVSESYNPFLYFRF